MEQEKKKEMKKKEKGFTLIELIVVLALIAIIAAIAIPNLTSVKDHSKKTADDRSSDTITRVVSMLVADETITPSATATKVAQIATDFTVTAPTAGSGEVACDGTELINLGKVLNKTKKPQESGKVFKISIAAVTGEVSVAAQ